MRITIHRGSHEIGGTCISIATTKTKLLIDAGLPLSENSAAVDINSIHPNAILISHPHADHFGMLDSIDPSIPVYMGRLSLQLINATRIFIRKPPLKNNVIPFRLREAINIGDIHIKPLLVDHSSPEAFAFEIKVGTKKLLYSGDFRGHGNKAGLFKAIIKNPPKDVDVMFMEGTCLRREDAQFPTEYSTFKTILDVLKGQGNITFLISSAQNIDRIVWAHHACQDTGKTMVIDLYTAWVLEAISTVSRKTPTMASKNIKVYFDSNFYGVLNRERSVYDDFIGKAGRRRIKAEELHANPARYLYLARISGTRKIKQFEKHGKVNIIYSQWKGYLDKTDNRYLEESRTLMKSNNFIYAHASGHAPLDDLKKMARAITPKKLVPIHTEHAKDFKKHFANVFEAEDNEAFEV